jgi:drug/metabolite transporter (DMT)-like permease
MLGYSLALLAATCWASGGLTAKWLFSHASAQTAGWPVPPLGISIDPASLAGARAVAAFVLLATWTLLARRPTARPVLRDMPFVALFGVAGLAGVHYTYFKALSLTNVATAILLQYLAPVIVLAVGVAFMGHRFSWALPAGVALSVGGCALVVGAIGGDGLQVTPTGIAWGLAAACFFAGYTLMGGVAANRFDPLDLLTYGLGFASAFWLIVIGPAAVMAPFAALSSTLAVLFVAVVSTIVPFSAYLYALHHIAPTNATIAATVEPVLAGVGAFALFGERMTLTQLAGALLVVCAIVVVELVGRPPVSEVPPQD